MIRQAEAPCHEAASSDIESRLKHLEDVEALRRMKHETYCGLIDKGVSTSRRELILPLLDRFTEDIVADFSGVGVFHGAAAARFFTQTVPDWLSWSQHRVSNEVIDVQGDVAHSSWYLFVPVISTEQGLLGKKGRVILIGRYLEEYMRQDGMWKWRKIRAEFDVLTSADQGWSEAVWSER
ncbi:MAG: nuclear transport factor 2 family protein [Proteobacteria bacterium]|nr:nuclear transport factor 2 family protein [Pseudomonadota bacterium]